MDSDDIMLPDSLAKQINIFQEHSDIHWSTYQPVELSAEGKQTPDPARIPTGSAEPGALNRAMAKLGRCPVHCAGLMIRTDTLRAFGGWAGLPVGEDVTLLAAVSELYHGWVMEGYGWLYRRHKSQITNSLKDPSWRTMGEDIGQQRIRAIKKLGWQV
jgi:hypothetical protein